MEVQIVVEGRTDEALVKRLLKHTRTAGHVRVANGFSSAVSMARSLLALGERVVLVVDADTDDSEAILERRRLLVASLSVVATPERWHLVLVDPCLELVLMRIPAVGRALLRREPTGRDLASVEAAKKALSLQRPEQLRRLRNLPAPVVELIAKHPTFGSLVEFLRTASAAPFASHML